MIETEAERKRKVIIEYIVDGFTSGFHAVSFADSVKAMIAAKGINVKCQVEIGTRDFKNVAITEGYIGETSLKMIFLDVPDQNTAQFITQGFESTVEMNSFTISMKVVREKPQAQTVTIKFIPKTSQANSIGG